MAGDFVHSLNVGKAKYRICFVLPLKKIFPKIDYLSFLVKFINSSMLK